MSGLYFTLKMPFFHLRLSSPSVSVKHAPNSLLWKISYYAVANVNFPSTIAQMNNEISVVRNISSFSSFNIVNRTNPSKCYSDSFEKQVSNVEIDHHKCPENFDDNKEWQRRRKIGLANKGRVPWNKGKKHNVETRKRIKQRTIEALSDPKVRKKMSEWIRTHSHQVKVKISSSLRLVWEERLKKKRLSEKFFQSWIESVAIAAKKGWKEQQELDWDSYDKIKQDMLHQELQWVAEKAKIKAMRKENAAKRKAEEKVCKQGKDSEKKAKGREDIHRELKKLTAVERLRLKQRLKKIRKKISINGAVTSQGSVKLQNTPWEKLDVELKKKSQVRDENSLADQIQVAKTRKAESVACKLLVASTLMYLHTTGSET